MKKFKKIGAFALCFVLVLSTILSGCGKSEEKPADSKEETSSVTSEVSEASETEKSEESKKDDVEKTEINIQAAASLTDVLNELIAEFEAANPQYKINMNYGASGALQTQIEEGAPTDVFFSAGQKQMTALDEGKFLVEGTNKPFLENKVVLIVPADSKLEITKFEDMANEDVKKVALGEFESVPVGQYSKEILENLNLLEGLQANDKISFGNDVRAVLAWIESGEADCGLVYSTDAAISDKVKIVAEAPEGSVKQIIYPVAAVNTGENADGGKEFIAFCSTPEAAEKFTAYGFAVVEG